MELKKGWLYREFEAASKEVEKWPAWMKGGASGQQQTRPSLTPDRSTPENRAHWDFVAKTAREVRSWPAWKRGHVRVCPNCDGWLDERGCKVRCRRCGYFEDCSDGMV